MQLPGLLVEYLINGSCALIWLAVLLKATGIDLPQGNDARLAILLPGLYVLGMIVDYLAVTVLKFFKSRIEERERQALRGCLIDSSHATITIHSADLAKELAMRSSRDRIARGALINSILVMAAFLILFRSSNRASLSLIILLFGLALSLVCFLMWRRCEIATCRFQSEAAQAISHKLSLKRDEPAAQATTNK